jgi:mRNA interferase MazF
VAGDVKRGDLVTVASQGDYGKPRPAVVIQSDALNAAPSVLVALLTSTLREAPFYRLLVEPTETNGLKMPSQIMVDKVLAYPRAKCGAVMGRLSSHDMLVLNNMLSVMIGLAD